MTERFEKKPEGEVLIGKDKDELLLGETLPDWVRTPLKLGGVKTAVLGGFLALCPRCQRGAAVTHLELEGDLFVAECGEGCGFVWYRRDKS